MPRILMIDDDRKTITLGRLILANEGFDVLSAYGCEESLEILYQENNIDLILLDTRMSAMESWQVFKAVRNTEIHAHIPIVMLTAQHYLKENYLSETCSNHLRKRPTPSPPISSNPDIH